MNYKEKCILILLYFTESLPGKLYNHLDYLRRNSYLDFVINEDYTEMIQLTPKSIEYVEQMSDVEIIAILFAELEQLCAPTYFDNDFDLDPCLFDFSDIVCIITSLYKQDKLSPICMTFLLTYEYHEYDRQNILQPILQLFKGSSE